MAAHLPSSKGQPAGIQAARLQTQRLPGAVLSVDAAARDVMASLSPSQLKLKDLKFKYVVLLATQPHDVRLYDWNVGTAPTSAAGSRGGLANAPGQLSAAGSGQPGA
jgi:hypothetical protein